MNWLANDVAINTDIFVLILSVLLTVVIGVLAWAIKQLINLGVIQARSTEQLSDLERRVGQTEHDIRVLSDRFLPRGYRSSPERNRPSPGT